MLFGQQMPLDLGPRFFQRRFPFGHMLMHLCDMESKGCPKHWTDLARLEREQDRVELRDHLAARKPSQIASSSRRIRKFVRNRIETIPSLDSFFNHADSSQRGLLRRLFIDVFYDVRGVNRLRNRHVPAMLPIIVDYVLVSWRSDAPRVANRQSFNPELQLDLRRISARFLDHVCWNRFRIGKCGLTQ